MSYELLDRLRFIAERFIFMAIASDDWTGEGVTGSIGSEVNFSVEHLLVTNDICYLI